MKRVAVPPDFIETDEQGEPRGVVAPAGLPFMRVVCSWCRADMGTRPCEPDLAGDITHGMCAACSASWWGARGKAAPQERLDQVRAELGGVAELAGLDDVELAALAEEAP